ncbi:hypothetical protein [Winogradskyella poriferorum]|uniref:hypothetical protein n=1 Tax=Winogradskyella poriferorum TaxID=307627 RepID=UPI003D662D8D
MRNAVSFLYLSILVVLFGCGKSNSIDTALNSDENTNQKEFKITEKTVEDIEYTDYVLSIEAEEAVEAWEKYKELGIQISYLKKVDLSFFNSESNLLVEFVDDFKSNVPENLQTNPILSRVAIVETTLLKLNADLTLDNITSTEQLESLEAVLTAYSNLNFQINKKLERDIYDKIQAE